VTTPAGTFDVLGLTIRSDAVGGVDQEWFVRAAAPHYLVRAVIRSDDMVETVELTDAGGLR
jgi:hypothetical protein